MPKNAIPDAAGAIANHDIESLPARLGCMSILIQTEDPISYHNFCCHNPNLGVECVSDTYKRYIPTYMGEVSKLYRGRDTNGVGVGVTKVRRPCERGTGHGVGSGIQEKKAKTHDEARFCLHRNCNILRGRKKIVLSSSWKNMWSWLAPKPHLLQLEIRISNSRSRASSVMAIWQDIEFTSRDAPRFRPTRIPM